MNPLLFVTFLAAAVSAAIQPMSYGTGPISLMRSAPIQMAHLEGPATLMRSMPIEMTQMAAPMSLVSAPAMMAAPQPMMAAPQPMTYAAAPMAYAAAPAPAIMAAPQPIQYVQPEVHIVQQAPVMVKAPVVEQRVHYENRPVVAGYNTEIMKPNLGMGLLTPGMDNLVTKTAIKAPVRTHTEMTEQITVQHPTKVNVEKIVVEVPVAREVPHPVPVPITPQVDVHHHAVPVVQQYAAAPIVQAAAPIQMIGGVQEMRTGLIGGHAIIGGMETGLIGGVHDMRSGLIGGAGLIGGVHDMRSGLIGGAGLIGGRAIMGGMETGLIGGMPSGVIVQ